MAKNLSDGLARLQNESRIPATTWRQWCNLLEMHPEDAIDVWEEICHPIMIANRKVPEIPYILQLRAGRPELDIYEFKEEVARVLHFITFLYNLEDERLTKGKIKSALLKLYRGIPSRVSPGPPRAFIERYLAEACALVVVAKVVRGESISLTGVLKPVVDGKASVQQVSRLAIKSLGDETYADAVRAFLQDSMIDPAAQPAVAANGNGRSTPADEDYEDEDGDEVDDGDGEDDVSAPDPVDLDDDDDDDDDDEDDEDDEDDDDDDDKDEDDEDYDDEDEDDEDEDAPIETALLKFKTALHAIYEYEAGVSAAGNEQADEDDTDEVLDERLKVTAAFDPLRAAIPSMEEAQNIARRLEAARNQGRGHRPTLGGRPTAAPGAGGGARAGGGGGGGGGAAGSGGGGGGGVTVIKGGGSGPSGGGGKEAEAPARGRTPPPRKIGGEEKRLDVAKVDSIAVEPTDFVDLANVSFPEFSDKAKQVCRQLATVEKLDQVVWSLFIDPAAAIGDVPGLTRTLVKESSQTQKAYLAIRTVAQHLPLKNLLSIPDKVLQKDRNFLLEVTQLINTVLNSNRELQPDGRQMAPLGKVLDHAACALVRLESLCTNDKLAAEHGEHYSRESATLYYEEALRQITDLTDRDLLHLAREKADADTVIMLGSFQARQLVEHIKEATRSYVKRLVESKQTQSADALKAHFAAEPLAFEGVEAKREGDVPIELLKPSELGEVFDATAKYVCSQAWSVTAEAHQPEKLVPELIGILRELMVSCFQFDAERRRHQDNPRLALSVISLDKVAGNANLKELYVRVRDDGQIHYVEDFEDGSYTDLFELREYKPQRLASAARKRAEEEETEALQTGRKYLFSVGRTNRLFGNTPADVINSCYRGEDGETKIFAAF